MVVPGEAARIARMQSTKCWAPPSFKSSRSTLVTTTYESLSRATVPARCSGSCTSGASGRPWATSQKGQRRVQMSPRIMKVAVPLPKHSAIFGQDASSHTVWRLRARRTCLTSWNLESGMATRTRIHAGFASGARGTILIGIRAVFAAPFSFVPASRMLEPRNDALGKALGDFARACAEAKLAKLRHLQPGIATRGDRIERRQIHIHIKCNAVIAAAPNHADPERRDLGAVHINSGRAGLAGPLALEQIEDRLLEKPDELLHLDAAPCGVDERIDDGLAGSMVGDLAAAVALYDRDGARRRAEGRVGALAERVHRRVLEEPQFIAARLGALARESAHRLPGRPVVDAAESLHGYALYGG